MDTAQSVQKPWTKKVLSYAFIFKTMAMPEEQENIGTEELNEETLLEIVPVLISLPPIFQIIFYKEDEKIQINDIYNCVLQGYKDTSNDPKLNEELGLVLDSLRNLETANRFIKNEGSANIPPVLMPLLNSLIEEGSLARGSIVKVGRCLCFLQLVKMPLIFLPSSKIKLSEQDEKA